MKDALKKIGAELAEEIARHFESDEVKGLVAETKAAPSGEAGTFAVVITTENLDRYQEVIKLDGWELERYLANPVVLWAHDHSQPIGVATNLSVQDGKMVAEGKFAPTPKAQEIRQLYDAGIIRATSVGFIEKEREGNLITKAELLEFSFVSVPANPYALSLAMEKEFSVNELVTKGFMVVEKEAEETPADDEPTEEEIEAAVSELEEDQDLHTSQFAPVIDSLKTAIIALEALGTKAGEPEGDEPVAETVEPTEEERAYTLFSENRKTVQNAATLLGDVLADMRQVVEARK